MGEIVEKMVVKDKTKRISLAGAYERALSLIS
jgi:hypothetical protein